ncbi:DUF6455 family protein [Sedimentitalea nanhaiensis]|uniref:DUF6455 domain-containing protein n=1 Tax=Sedimentitalea nanhaiensis TaxID=999627 RepID=A0A1I7E7B1_9RHOB|nr:DUF6455 family protein [Sedimentitalea nanhaiensis]SFU19828.1 hypothetical protein SAMN05216236_1483 [Sedimentitalea nanhaiensis]
MDGGGGRIDRTERHFWLTRSMARVMGVNLMRAMEQGLLSPEDYGEMVARCQAGKCHEICQLWLARQTGVAAKAPDHCLHRDVLDRLRGS